MEELDKMKGDAERARKWIAAMFGYTQELEEQLEKADSETDPKRALAYVEHGFHIIDWEGKSLSEGDKGEKRLQQDLKVLVKKLPDDQQPTAKELYRQFKVTRAKIVAAGARYTGDLRSELRKIETYEKLMARSDDQGETIKAHLHKLFEEAEEDVRELIKWISSNQEVIRKIIGFEEELERREAA